MIYSGPQIHGQLRAIPQAYFFQAREEIFPERQRHTLAGQQTLDTIDVMGPFSFDRYQFAMQLALIFFFRAGNMYDALDLLLALQVAHQHGHQLANIHSIGLCPPLTSVHFDTG